MIKSDDCILILIDIQERLVEMLNKQEPIKKVCSTLVKASKALEIPIILTEQYPKGLGITVPEINSEVDLTAIVEKTSFSAMQTEEFIKLLKNTNRKTVILGGIETHICVYQTAFELIQAGYNVAVIKDACASRTKEGFKIGIERMKSEGAKIYNVETMLFELLRSSKHPKFKEIQTLIK